MHPKKVFVTVATLVSLLALTLGLGGTAQAADDFSSTGRFEAPFSENGDYNDAPPATIVESMEYPTAVSAALLPKVGAIAYWNGLQSLESAKYPLAADAAGLEPQNSQSRVIDLDEVAPDNDAEVSLPTPNDGGANDDLFCADQRILLDGSILAAGGTIWKNDPIDAAPLNDALAPTGQRGPHGSAELFGSPSARILSANGNTWTAIDPMARGRWYPGLVTLPDGRLFVAGGVGRLLYNAPIFKNADGTDATGTNVSLSETFDPYVGGAYNPIAGTWSSNEDNVTFPLFPRLRLLPSGKVLYDGVGQMWGPFGQGYDQALWNVMKTWDPVAEKWEDLGVGVFGAMSGAADAMLPITWDSATNDYSKEVKILHAGGTLGTSPGSFIAHNLSEILTVHADGTFDSERGPDLVNRRWYSSNVLGPDGRVYIFSGADKDEVVAPAQERAVRQAEVYDPATNSFKALDTATRDRTYHNSAILLPDGRILVGGHSPINNLYGPGADDANSEHDVTGQIEAATGLPVGTANNLKDPSFQIFTPPYLLNADGTEKARPDIQDISGILEWGSERQITLNGSADENNNIAKVMLIHAPATTHITDADARTVELKITEAGANGVKVKIPGDTIAPPGFYYVFAVNDKGVPSEAAIVRVGNETVFQGVGAFVAPKLDVKAPLGKSSSSAASAPAGSKVDAEPAAARRAVPAPGNGSRNMIPVVLAAALVSLLGAAGVRTIRRMPTQ